MKDFYDLEILSRTFAFEGKLSPMRFKTPFNNVELTFGWEVLPVAFTSEFYDDVNKNGRRCW